MTAAAQSVDELARSLVTAQARRDIAQRARATVIGQLFDLGPRQLIPQLFSEIGVVYLAWNHANRLHLLAWFLMLTCVHHPLEWWALRSLQRRPVQPETARKWRDIFRLLGGSVSLSWCYAYWFFGFGSPQESLFFVLGMGVMFVMAQYARAELGSACTLVIPIFLTLLGAHLSRHTATDLVQVFFVLLAFSACFLLVIQQSAQTFEALYARFLSEELARVLRAMNEEVTRAKIQAEVANRAKSRFFAAASHDLRQPLHALSLLLGSVQQDLAQLSLRSRLEQMAMALGSLELMFAEVLDIARIESGKVVAKLAPVSVDALLRKLAMEFEPVAAAKGLELRVRASGAVIASDPLLVERVLRNLIANAIKYTDRGGVLLACRPIDGRMAAKIQVFDTGIGIPDQELPLIFDDFY